MNPADIRKEFRQNPEYAFLGLFLRIAELEAEVVELKKPKRIPRKKANGN